MYSKQENIRMVKQSLDMMVYKRMLIAVGIGTGLGLLYGLGMALNEDPELFRLFLIIGAIFVIPTAGIWVWRMWKLFRELEEYFFTKATLTSFHQSWWSRGICFTVVIDHPEEGTVAVSTNPIFRPTGWEQPLLQDYMNKTVTIGYNRETGMVVVIG